MPTARGAGAVRFVNNATIWLVWVFTDWVMLVLKRRMYTPTRVIGNQEVNEMLVSFAVSRLMRIRKNSSLTRFMADNTKRRLFAISAEGPPPMPSFKGME